MIRVAILGASGFVGAELLRLLAMHPGLEPVAVFGDSQAGQRLADVHPHLALAYPELVVERYSAEALRGAGLVFAALPHGHSQALAPEILASGAKFVRDLKRVNIQSSVSRYCRGAERHPLYDRSENTK